MPVIGEGAPSRLVVYHGGSMQGFTASVYLLPETETAIFALQNSTGLCDPCDWVPQLLIETIFGTQNGKVNFEQLAGTAAATGAGLADRVQKQLEQARKPGTKPRKLVDYVGKYWNRARSFNINVTVDEDGELYMCFQNVQDETYKLWHYHDDVFVWNQSHNETAKRGRFQTRPLASYKIAFESADQNKDSKIDRLRWMFDETHPAPGVFMRATTGGCELNSG